MLKMTTIMLLVAFLAYDHGVKFLQYDFVMLRLDTFSWLKPQKPIVYYDSLFRKKKLWLVWGIFVLDGCELQHSLLSTSVWWYVIPNMENKFSKHSSWPVEYFLDFQ